VSALPPKADIHCDSRNVRFVPKAGFNAIPFPLTRRCHMREGKHNSLMPPLLDFWFDFASTYSYPAAMLIAPLARQSGVLVRFRPFLVGPLFKAMAYFSVQSLSRKGPLYVAGPRADLL